MIDLDRIPMWLKAMVGIGLFLMGPIMVFSLWFGGTRGGIAAVLSIIVYFTVVYIVGIRRYMSDH
jgi:hypothetical protein